MISVFNLQTLTESAVSGSTALDINSIKGVNYIGTMSEMASDFDFALMSEAVDFNAYVVGSDEILTEAAMGNPDALGTLSENVFTSIVKRGQAIIAKLMAMVKGIINKLKAYYAKLTGKTDKWASLMKPKIEAAKRESGSTEVTAEMHKWNIDLLTSKLPAAMTKIVDVADKALTKEDISNTIDTLIRNYKGKSADDPDVKSAVERFRKAVDSVSEDSSANIEEVYKTAASELGLSNDTSVDAIWNELIAKVTGGEKVTVKYNSSELGIDKMMSAIEGSKKTITDLQKAYDEQLKSLSKLKASYDKLDVNASKIDDEKEYPSAIINAARDMAKGEIDMNVKLITAANTALNRARDVTTNQLQAMTSEYMSVLTKFAGFKGKK